MSPQGAQKPSKIIKTGKKTIKRVSQDPSTTKLASRPPKNSKLYFLATHFGGHFCYFSALLGNHFLMCFWSVTCSHPGCFLGRQYDPKAPEMEPKLIQKRTRRHFMECVKTIVFIVLQAHGQVLDMTLEPLFSRSQREALYQGVLRVTKGILL